MASRGLPFRALCVDRMPGHLRWIYAVAAGIYFFLLTPLVVLGLFRALGVESWFPDLALLASCTVSACATRLCAPGHGRRLAAFLVPTAMLLTTWGIGLALAAG